MIDVAFRSETEAVVRKATPVPASFPALCFDFEAAHRDNGNPKLFRPIGPASGSLEVLGSNFVPIIEDICVSVPDILRSLGVVRVTESVNWAYSLLWPLSVAHESGHVPVHLLSNLHRQIEIISDITSSAAADHHTKALGANIEPEVWSVLTKTYD